jgi:LPPG:FO 2-phospho-L-lactate transferase
MSTPDFQHRILTLCGGIGGAKLALGFYRTIGSNLTVIVNTGDDFEHFGLNISPDLDTLLYTLAGLSDPVRGWGRAQESWQFLETMGALGGETWFQLGDCDLAMHVQRTEWLRAGEKLSAFTAHVARQFGITARVLPMSDNAVRTMVDTTEGRLPFQRYFVERGSAPVVKAIHFAGAPEARPLVDALDLIANPSLRAIVICPSNPYLSIDPILAVPGIADALMTSPAPVIAVSPLIGGKAIKGPTAKIMAELGIAITNLSIAAHYGGLINGLVIDETDAGEGQSLKLPVLVTRTLMRDLADRDRLASEIMMFADKLACSPQARRAGGG